MNRKHMKRAAAVAVDMAVDVEARLPASYAVPAEVIFAAVWPVACNLERLERRARKDRRKAKAHRKAVRRARREVEQLLATQDGGPVTVPALLRTVPLRGDMWRVALVPGAPAEDFAAESEAA